MNRSEIVAKIALEVARGLRVDLYDAEDHPGLEEDDMYLHEQKRDVVLYRRDGAGIYSDTLVCRFLATSKALFGLEVNADFLDMVDAFDPAALGLRFEYRNECTLIRHVQPEDVSSVVTLLVRVVELGIVRTKQRQETS